MNIAIIIAGGSGHRMGQDIPKQFINVYDKPILIYTLEEFLKRIDCYKHDDISLRALSARNSGMLIRVPSCFKFNIEKRMRR